MQTVADCLELLRVAKNAAQDTDSAYAIRTRLKRSLLGIASLVAAQTGTAPPEIPDHIDRMPSNCDESTQVLSICKSLLTQIRALCQPSEALDSRWRAGWSLLQQDLEKLEVALQALHTRH
jgi:hypothetical protein